MKRIFADTLYWIALIHPQDQWHPAATQANQALKGCHLLMTDEVLVEVLAAFCEAGPPLRRGAAALARRLQHDPNVTVFPQSRQTFLAGLTLYEARPDKGYSLTDCISMETMRREGVSEVLTHDHHFVQEGFTCLL